MLSLPEPTLAEEEEDKTSNDSFQQPQQFRATAERMEQRLLLMNGDNLLLLHGRRWLVVSSEQRGWSSGSHLIAWLDVTRRNTDAAAMATDEQK